MRVIALHEDVIVAISAIWQTTCTAIRSGEEGFVIDSPVLPEELEALPSVLEQAQFPVSGLLCTHVDWDHVMGRLAFPDVSLGAGEPSVRRLAGDPGEPERELRDWDEEWYVERGTFSLAGIQSLPVPGRLSIGSRELELHLTGGHTADGTAYLAPWAGVLVAGDYLSRLEIPMLSQSGSIEAYLATLERLSGVLAAAETVVPGHGAPYPRTEAEHVLAEDVAYLEALRASGDAPLPQGRRSGTQEKIHAENLARVAG